MNEERRLMEQARRHSQMLAQKAKEEKLKQKRELAEKAAERERAKQEEKELKEKEAKRAAYKQWLDGFLKVDSYMKMPSFYRVKSPEDYKHRLFDDKRIPDFSGIYIIANISKKKIYVGQGKNVIKRCYEHFRDRTTTKDNVPQIREDILSGDVILINFVQLNRTDFNTLDELEYYYTHYYGCIEPYGYNHVKPPKTNKAVRRVNQTSKYYMFEYVEDGDIAYSEAYKQSGICKGVAEVTCLNKHCNVRLFSSDGVDRHYYGKWIYNEGSPYYVRGQ